MRRILPVFVLSLGLATVLVSDTAEARHHRCHKQRCCAVCTAATFPKYCPKYRMLQMGGLYHYYTLEYDTDCNSSFPISYDTTDGNLNRPCDCSPDVCCFPKPVMLDGSYKKFSAGDHVPDNNAKSHKADAHIPPDDPMRMHGDVFLGTSTLREFTAVIDEGSGNIWWVRAGQFRCAPLFYPSMPVNVGYEVDDGTSPDVDSGHTSISPPDSDFPYLRTLTVTFPAGNPKAKYNGAYQILRAN
jgi:hypothetical protein